MDQIACDIITGGFPCQDISNAGKRAGITGARSGLWGEMVRTIRMVRPKYVLVENVAALLNRGMGTVLGDLAAIGYDAEWDCLPAAAVGAPHCRDRAFIIAYMQSCRRKGFDLSIRSGRPFQVKIDTTWLGPIAPDPNSPRRTDNQRQCSAAETHRRPVVGTIAGRPGSWWAAEPSLVRVVHGVPDALDRVRCLGNAVVPQVAQWIGERILAAVDEKEK